MLCETIPPWTITNAVLNSYIDLTQSAEPLGVRNRVWETHHTRSTNTWIAILLDLTSNHADERTQQGVWTVDSSFITRASDSLIRAVQHDRYNKNQSIDNADTGDQLSSNVSLLYLNINANWIFTLKRNTNPFINCRHKVNIVFRNYWRI